MKILEIERRSPIKCRNLNYTFFTSFYQANYITPIVDKTKELLKKANIMEEQFSCRTASKYYSYSDAFFRKLIQNKLVPFHKLGRSVRFKKSDLDAFMEAKRGK